MSCIRKRFTQNIITNTKVLSWVFFRVNSTDSLDSTNKTEPAEIIQMGPYCGCQSKMYDKAKVACNTEEARSCRFRNIQWMPRHCATEIL